MPSMKKINQIMVEQGISTEILAQFDFTEWKGNNPEPMIAIIDQMDKFLTKENALQLWKNKVVASTESVIRIVKLLQKSMKENRLSKSLHLCLRLNK